MVVEILTVINVFSTFAAFILCIFSIRIFVRICVGFAQKNQNELELTVTGVIFSVLTPQDSLILKKHKTLIIIYFIITILFFPLWLIQNIGDIGVYVCLGFCILHLITQIIIRVFGVNLQKRINK